MVAETLVFAAGAALLSADGDVMVGSGIVAFVPLAGVRPPFAPVAEIKESAFA